MKLNFSKETKHDICIILSGIALGIAISYMLQMYEYKTFYDMAYNKIMSDMNNGCKIPIRIP